MITTFASDISVQCQWYARRANRNQILLTCLASGGGPFSLVGYTFTFKAWTFGQESSPAISLTQGAGITNGGAAGTILLDITEAQSTLNPNIFLMKLEATHPDTYIRTWINGTWILNGDLYDGAATTAVTVNLNATGTPVTLVLNLPGDPVTETQVSVTGSTVTLDMANATQKLFVGSATVSANKTIALSNASAALVFNLKLLITGAVNLTMPSTFKMADTRWNSGTKILTLTGVTNTRFELSATYDNVNLEWALKASPDSGYQ
jgi:hypothetical protein